MKVLIIGANGNTAMRLVRRLREQGEHEPIAMVRDPAQRPRFDALDVQTVVGDLEYPIDDAVAGAEAVIFAAGSGGKTGRDKTVLVDHIGAIRSMVTASVQGARRYIMLSSLNNDIRSTSPIAHYHKAKAHADQHLMETDLEWTIVCPGSLTDEPGSDTVAVSSKLHGRGTTSRDNLAAALALCLDRPNTIGKVFSLLDGKTPIDVALAKV